MSLSPSRTAPARMGRLSHQLHQVLLAHVSAPWPLVQAQCRRLGLDAAALTPDGLALLIQPVALSVGRHAGPAAGVAARRDLVALLRRVSAPLRPSAA